MYSILSIQTIGGYREAHQECKKPNQIVLKVECQCAFTDLYFAAVLGDYKIPTLKVNEKTTFSSVIRFSDLELTQPRVF